jgi:hypothetical protein
MGQGKSSWRSIALLLGLIVCCFNSSCKKDSLKNEIVTEGNIGDCNELLGRPTSSSVTMNIIFSSESEVYWEIGTSAGTYNKTTDSFVAKKDVPLVTDFSNLLPNTRYYYQTRYRANGTDNTFIAGTEHSFMTCRSPGSTFVFTVEADPHPYDKKGSHNLWNIALQNQLSDNADFIIDLGDTFGDDHNVSTITSQQVKQLQLNNREFFGSVCHSLPLFFCLGNHEGERGYYLLQSPPNNLATY